jgi:hypothetical protein
MMLGMVIIQIHFLALDNRTLDQIEGQKVTAIGVVTTDPNLTRSRVIGSQSLPARATFIMRLEEARNADFKYKFRIPVRVILDRAEITSLHPGDLISIEGNVSNSKERRVAGVLYSKSKSIEVIEEPIFRNRFQNSIVNQRI